MEKLLVVEDESIIALELEEHLTAMGYEVVGRASSGVEAIAKARELRPDLILMDIVMPGEKSGIDAAEEIKSEMDVPVIFVTAYADEEFIKSAKTVGPFGYIVKPYEDRELRAGIEIALYRKGMERELQKAHDELERRVKERTAELERSNEQLRTEISERKQAEQKVKKLELSALHRLFKHGKCYLLVEEKPDTCFKLFNKLIEYGFKGMLISRIHPSQIQEEYNVKEIPTIWLTQVREENCIEPTNITQLSIAVKGFAEKGVEGVILLEGLEYLIVQNGFEVVLRFVQTMADIVMISKCRLIISFDAQTLGDVELHRLERELNVMNANEVKVLILD